LPLVLLGVLKQLRASEAVSWVLLVVGILILFLQWFQIFLAPHGSTSALGMILTPLYVLFIYGVAWGWLMLRKSGKKGAG
jgi:drug/metabolite transporter (DMT)-like permease